MKRSLIPVLILLALAFNSQICSGAKKVHGSGNVVTEERQVKDFAGVELATIGKLYIQIGTVEKLEIEAEDNILPYLETEVDKGSLVIKVQKRVDLRPKEPIRYYLTVKKLERIVLSSAGDVEAPDINSERFTIISSSAGDLEMGDLETGFLKIRMSSAGDVSIGDVKARDIEVSISSAGDLSMEEVEVTSLEVQMSSAGDCRIERLKAESLDLSNSSAGTMIIREGQVKEQDISLSSAGDYQAKNLKSLEATVRLSSVGSATINVKDRLSVTVSSLGSVYYIGSPEIDYRITSRGKIKRIGD